MCISWKEKENRKTCKQMFIAFVILFAIAKDWKQTTYFLMDKWWNKLWYIHTMEYYPTTKTYELLIHRTIWKWHWRKCAEWKNQSKRSYIVWFYLYNLLKITNHRNGEEIRFVLCVCVCVCYFPFFFFFICSEFCHTLKWKGLRFTCLPHPDPPSPD